MNKRPNYDKLRDTGVTCHKWLTDDNYIIECPTGELCLYNLRNDPCEYHNLMGEMDHQFVRFLWQKLVDFNSTSVPPLSLVPLDDRSNPIHHNNTWVNWLDDELGDSVLIHDKHQKTEL